MNIHTLALAGMLALLAACNSKPTVVEATSQEPSAVEASNREQPQQQAEMHEVVVEDFLHASRYTYLDVSEDGERFWIAIPRKDVEKGATYYYMGGLLKRNFHSTEHNRTFETIYLVSDVRREPIYGGGSAVDQAFAKLDEEQPHVHEQDVAAPEGGISLEELFTNREKYEGKEVKVSGQCVKINKQIMGRNWVHIRDGSGDDEPYDLTVTTSADVPVGAVVTFSGIIALNKDFGSGYFYEVIMEDGHTH